MPHRPALQPRLMALSRSRDSQPCLTAVPHSRDLQPCLTAVPHSRALHPGLTARPHGRPSQYLGVHYSRSSQGCLTAVPHSRALRPCFTTMPHSRTLQSCLPAVPHNPDYLLVFPARGKSFGIFAANFGLALAERKADRPQNPSSRSATVVNSALCDTRTAIPGTLPAFTRQNKFAFFCIMQTAARQQKALRGKMKHKKALRGKINQNQHATKSTQTHNGNRAIGVVDFSITSMPQRTTRSKLPMDDNTIVPHSSASQLCISGVPRSRALRPCFTAVTHSRRDDCEVLI